MMPIPIGNADSNTTPYHPFLRGAKDPNSSPIDSLFTNKGVSREPLSLPALYLSGTYWHRTSIDPLAVQTPQHPTIQVTINKSGLGYGVISIGARSCHFYKNLARSKYLLSNKRKHFK